MLNLSHRFQVAVRISNNTLFWKDVWFGDQTLLNFALVVISSVESFKIVRDYWHPLSGRDWAKLDTLLPSHITHRLATTMLNSDANIEDAVLGGLYDYGVHG